ncbi:MAG: hypothetical protein ABI456_10995, partial [Ktedonobacteraceae bacterium]
MNVRNLFSKKTQEHLLSRRTALKGTLLGAAALFPFVEEVPGVSAASLGLNQSNVKALPLTGATLQQELKKLRVQPRCASAEAFVKQKGFEVTDVLAEGYYLYRKTGAHWSRETFLTLSYTSTQGASETAA